MTGQAAASWKQLVRPDQCFSLHSVNIWLQQVDFQSLISFCSFHLKFEVIVHQLLLSLSRWTSLTLLINLGINFPLYDFKLFRGSRTPNHDAPSTSSATFFFFFVGGAIKSMLCTTVHHDFHPVDSWTEMLISSDGCFKPLAFTLWLFSTSLHILFSGRAATEIIHLHMKLLAHVWAGIRPSA